MCLQLISLASQKGQARLKPWSDSSNGTGIHIFVAQQKVGDFFVPTFTGGLAMPGLLHTLGAQECRVTACLGPTAWRETHKLTDKSVTHAMVESWVGVHRQVKSHP